MAEPIQAIIFDCFGVLVSESWLSFKKEFFGHDQTLSKQATHLLQQADGGLISHEQFISQISTLASIEPHTVQRYLDKNAPNEDLFRYISEVLKPNYKIGMLSNAAADWLTKLFSSKQLALFDAISLSFESGVIKPNEEAYVDITHKLGVDIERCIFVDDQERHCRGARQAGMQALMYHDFEQFRKDLEEALK